MNSIMSRPRTRLSDRKFQCNVDHMGITRNDELFIDRFNKVLSFFEFMLSNSVPSIMFISTYRVIKYYTTASHFPQLLLKVVTSHLWIRFRAQ